MKKALIYLDYNAAMPLRPSALKEMLEVLSLTGNPSSIHRFGHTLAMRIENARHKIATCLNSLPAEIIFTSGGTEANNLVLQSHYKNGYDILVSAVEHDSVLKSIENLEIIPVNSQGIICLENLETLLSNKTQPTLISVMLANNETGVIQPLNEIIAIAKRHKALVHTDAAQAVGRVPCNFKDLDVDFMTLSSLKVGGPAGVGALIAKEKLPLTPLLMGGGQERGKRAGTPNTAGICGFATAIIEASQEDWHPCQVLRDQLELSLQHLTPEAYIFGQKTSRLPNTMCISLPNNRSDKYVMMYDLEGIAISAGSACSSGKIKASHVLKAMKASEDYLNSAIRVSLGIQTTKEEIEAFCKIWQDMAMKFQSSPLTKNQNLHNSMIVRKETYVSADL
ncbi:MAG: cysteine desulfurase [Candidatus Paracaedimonas acanthamoebae]|uniref:Cysteine desulfurase n=1 Tax=Candidatus Paracaedimonas acanthamoebae TaxID=244581 RepID=A0A8J7PHL7_9PROT|nr:cysteine desulfurase [Candidatus Paracaedimonas acanthamoebae]